MNRKSVFALVAVSLLAALAGGSWLVGAQARQALADQVEAVNGRGRLKLTVESYAQGIFASTATLKVDIPAGSIAEARTFPVPGHVLLDLRLSLAHGPLPLAGGVYAPALAALELRPVARPDTPAPLRDLLAAWPEGQGVLGRLVVGWDRGGEFAVHVPPARRTMSGDASVGLEWRGGDWRGSFTPDFASLRGEAWSDGLELRDKEATMRLAGVRLVLDAAPQADLPWLGRSAFSAQRASVAAGDGSAGVALRDVTTEAAISLTGDLLQFDVRAAAAGLEAGAQSMGPLELRYVLRNIDRAAFAAWQQDLRAQQDSLTDAPPEQVQTAFLASLIKAAAGLVARSPVFEVTAMRAKTPEGDVDGRLKVAVVNPRGETVADPGRLLGMLQAEADVTMAAKLVRKLALLSLGQGDVPTDPEMTAFAESMIDEQIDDLLKRKLLVQEGGQFRAQAGWKDGVLQINGRPMPFL